MEFLTWDPKQSDKAMLQKLVPILSEADEIVMHNGDKFDLPFIRTRALVHSIPMEPKYRTIDTLKVARNAFRFNSNRLDYLGKFLGLNGKIGTTFSLWKEVQLNNSMSALKQMVKYCQNDVVLLMKVYKALQNHIPAKTHYGVIIGNDRGSCPECGSEHIIINKIRTSASGNKSVTYQCKKCGKYHQQPFKNVSNNQSSKAGLGLKRA